MTQWDRREADTLADAIGKHIAKHPEPSAENAKLGVIRIAVDGASHTVQTSAGDLHRYRSEVCAICRAAQLYPCDVPAGWSKNCALVYSNASEFGALGPS
jgi:hypothetical protein